MAATAYKSLPGDKFYTQFTSSGSAWPTAPPSLLLPFFSVVNTTEVCASHLIIEKK